MKELGYAVRYILLGGIVLYRRLVSPLKPRTCRFYPSCSEYAYEAVARYGALRGLRLSLVRLAKCHPWNPGGYDPVP